MPRLTQFYISCVNSKRYREKSRAVQHCSVEIFYWSMAKYKHVFSYVSSESSSCKLIRLVHAEALLIAHWWRFPEICLFFLTFQPVQLVLYMNASLFAGNEVNISLRRYLIPSKYCSRVRHLAVVYTKRFAFRSMYKACLKSTFSLAVHFRRLAF